MFGIAANSVALIADAAHNLGDVLALLLARGAARLIRRPPTARRTYGRGRSSILAVLVIAVVLLIGVGAIGIEAVRRPIDPEPVATGIVVNGGSALLFTRDQQGDLNIRAQFQHLAGDAVVSLAVILAALAIRLTGLPWLDPIVSLGVAAIIVLGTWSTLREALSLSLDAVPGMQKVHDLHI